MRERERERVCVCVCVRVRACDGGGGVPIGRLCADSNAHQSFIEKKKS